MKYRIVIILISVLLISLSLYIYLYYFPIYTQPNLSLTENQIIYIPKGSSFDEITTILTENGSLKDPKVFSIIGKISGYQHKIIAGHLIVPNDLAPWHLLKYLNHPQIASKKITIPEGLRSIEIASLLAKETGVDSSRFMQLISDTNFIKSFSEDAKITNLEGYLLPETYNLPLKVNEEYLIRLLVSNTLRLFKSDSIETALKKHQWSIHDILTLASIIEGEVMVDSERVIVSSVYHNRLQKDWLLQADPTIQYILPGNPRRLYLKDLEIDSPYNTYKYKGLPPGPINNPGKKSIYSAIYPANTTYMFFVATGDGGHYFSETSSEHLRNKEKLDRIRINIKKSQGY